MTSLPKQILEATTAQLAGLRMFEDPMFFFMLGKFIEAEIEVMKSGRATSFEQLVELTIEKLEEVEENHPFFD